MRNVTAPFSVDTVIVEHTLSDTNSNVMFKAVRQCGPVVRALALRSGDPGFKTRSNHSLNLFLVFSGSTSRPHL